MKKTQNFKSSRFVNLKEDDDQCSVIIFYLGGFCCEQITLSDSICINFKWKSFSFFKLREFSLLITYFKTVLSFEKSDKMLGSSSMHPYITVESHVNW